MKASVIEDLSAQLDMAVFCFVSKAHQHSKLESTRPAHSKVIDSSIVLLSLEKYKAFKM